MKKIINSIAALLVFCPSALLAGTDCRVVELPDRYEAICVGDEKLLPSNLSQPSRPIAVEKTVTAASTAPVATGNAGKTEVVSSAASSTGEVKKNESKELPSAVAQLVAFRNNKLQRKDLEAKKAIRMQNIIAGRKNEVIAPQADNYMEN